MHAPTEDKDDDIKDSWVGHVACTGRGEVFTVERPEGKRPLGRARHRWVDDIKMDLRKIGLKGAKWIWLAQDRVQWRAFVSTVMDCRVPQRSKIFFDKLSDYQLFK
jgi:hypothetical protein